MGNGGVRPLQRAIVFTDRIKSSQLLATHWKDIVDEAQRHLPESEQNTSFRCETQHVDGKVQALNRKARIEWLKGSSEESDSTQSTCRILSNARCLSEGIDVPALDAVIFMTEKRSVVDIVQAVGRVMRKTDGKNNGYIIIPIAVREGEDPAEVLDRGSEFDTVWSVLRALRSHDERLDAEINQIDLNNNPQKRIIFGSMVGQGEDFSNEEFFPDRLAFPRVDLPANVMYAKIVEKCGDRKYWESWAKDVAEIFARLVFRIENLLKTQKSQELESGFVAFHEELKKTINDSIARDTAIEIIAQHILTRPVFDAMFEGNEFVRNNPVARALDVLHKQFDKYGLENECRDLEGFYESVRMRARGLDNPAAKQTVLMELYEKFFATAMKNVADEYGIVYTPVEIVDFILHSVEFTLQKEFGRSMTDKGVNVLDPFAGTGIFLVRLLQLSLIKDSDLERKFGSIDDKNKGEIHANEILLLAYYIAATNIEQAFSMRMVEQSENSNNSIEGYQPFGGIVLTDTFNLESQQGEYQSKLMLENNKRARRQQEENIEVIVGNPPWNAFKKQSYGNNPDLYERISETYAKYSRSTLKNKLRDSYKLALRWASDRIGKPGVIGFVTNASWLRTKVDSGIRSCLNNDFSSIYIVDLKGRIPGVAADGGNVFDVKVPVSIVILVKKKKFEGCQILYHALGERLNKDQKLNLIRETKSIQWVKDKDWEALELDDNNDWLEKVEKGYEELNLLGSKKVKANKLDEEISEDEKSEKAIFQLYSLGYATNRDAYIYNFSVDACLENARLMIEEYHRALDEIKENPYLEIKQVTSRHNRNTKWNRELNRRLKRNIQIKFSIQNIDRSQYRPFVKQHCYADYDLVSSKGQMDCIFPWSHLNISNPPPKNKAICVPGLSAIKQYSVLMTDTLPDLNLMEAGCQCFPRWKSENVASASSESEPQNLFQPSKQTPSLTSTNLNSGNVEWEDNITDWSLNDFQSHYDDFNISKDDIFDYVYGVLHAPELAKRYRNALSKKLPRIPKVKNVDDFYAFVVAGRTLGDLHLGYETCPEYPLQIEISGNQDLRPEDYRLENKMRLAKEDKSVLVINDRVSLKGIPDEAHEYIVNDRSPLGWLIYRYKSGDEAIDKKKSGKRNDGNDWWDDPRDLITAIKRIVYVSVETRRIVKALPDPFEGER